MRCSGISHRSSPKDSDGEWHYCQPPPTHKHGRPRDHHRRRRTVAAFGQLPCPILAQRTGRQRIVSGLRVALSLSGHGHRPERRRRPAGPATPEPAPTFSRWVDRGARVSAPRRRRSSSRRDPRRSGRNTTQFSGARRSWAHPRTSRVAALVLQGRSTRSIVAELEISANTVQEHLRAVFDKFGIGSRQNSSLSCPDVTSSWINQRATCAVTQSSVATVSAVVADHVEHQVGGVAGQHLHLGQRAQGRNGEGRKSLGVAAHTIVLAGGRVAPLAHTVKLPLPTAAFTSSTLTMAAVAPVGTVLVLTVRSRVRACLRRGASSDLGRGRCPSGSRRPGQVSAGRETLRRCRVRRACARYPGCSRWRRTRGCPCWGWKYPGLTDI